MSIQLIKAGKNKGHYRVRIQPVNHLTGKKVSIPSQVTKTCDHHDAELLENKMWMAYRGQKDLREHKLDQPVATEFHNYVNECRKLGKWSSSTAYDWQYTAKLVKHYFGREKIKDVRESDVSAFAHHYVREHNTKVSKHSTVDRQLQNLRCFFSKMERYGLKVNPVPKGALNEFFRRSDMTRPSKKFVFSDDDIHRIKSEIYDELSTKSFIYWGSRLAILIALDTGMRPQEIQALRWTELVEEDGYIVFQIRDSWNERSHKLNPTLKDRMQGDTRKTLPLSNRTIALLKEYHKKQSPYLIRKGIHNKDDFILLSLTDYARCSAGFPVAQRSMNDMLKGILNTLQINGNGLSITMYTCRHTVATKLGNNPGASYPWVASRLGHTLEMFMRTYVHPDEDKNKTMLKLVVLSRAQ